MPDDNTPVHDRNGSFVEKVAVIAVGSLLVMGVGALFGLWSGLLQLRSEFDLFGKAGCCTDSECSELTRRVLSNENRYERLHEDYTGHKAWGRQWTVETGRRLDHLERRDGSYKFLQDKR